MNPVVRRVLATVTLLSGLTALLLGAMLLVPPPGTGPVPCVRNADLHELPGSDDAPWSIALISDVQNGAAYLPELLRRAELSSPRAIVITGDLSAAPPPEFGRIPVWYLRHHPPTVPVFIVPGNHDILRHETLPSVGEREFLSWYGCLTFDFRIGHTNFIGLDNSTGSIVGRPLEALHARLDEARTRRERTVVLLHRNIVPFDEPDSTAESTHLELRELLLRYDVPYVLCGHLHHEAYDSRGGTRFVAVPASGHRPANEPGQKPIGFVTLRWTGTTFELGQEEFYRRNSIELEGVFIYLALAKIHPLFEQHPMAGSALVGLCLALSVAGSGLLWRSRKGGV